MDADGDDRTSAFPPYFPVTRTRDVDRRASGSLLSNDASPARAPGHIAPPTDLYP